MKRLISMICFLPLFTSAQRIKTSIDKLTGDTIIYTTYEEIGSKFSTAFSYFLTKEKKLNYLTLQVRLSEYLPKVEKGSELNFRLANGQIIALYATHTFESKPDVFYSETPIDLHNFSLSPRYQLDENAINQLKSSPVVLIRFHYDATYKDYEIEPTQSSKFLKEMQLIY
ncbi:hypothetical protein OCK74_04380 [Chitinophagaceae bacterium LB-8]|uniref:Uncharacterized protein n=1 Tax=Paraflavisolibacter caeni TaxID=2982496 RepID=A0A9X2XSW3_9BACT|nr:hypothetical protein [Paraflavisolibacter caeni]MCU7548336.1 hypothetical protein [Paraflavisolibacter caeni]